MKKILLGLIIGLVVGGSFAVVHAWSQQQESSPIVGVQCSNSIGNNGYVSGTCSWTVDTFTNNGDRCYVVTPNHGGSENSISCVKN